MPKENKFNDFKKWVEDHSQDEKLNEYEKKMDEATSKALDSVISSLNKFFSKKDIESSREKIEFALPSIYLYLVDNHQIPNPDPQLIEIAKARYKEDRTGFCKDIIDLVSSVPDSELNSVIMSLISGEDGLLYKSSYVISGSPINELVYKLLKVKEGDSIYDLGSGIGTTLANFYLYSKEDEINLNALYGAEINSEHTDLASMLLSILTRNEQTPYTLKSVNALNSTPFKYRKGYVYPPIGQYQTFRTKRYDSLLYPDVSFNSSFQEQWIFVDRLLAGLEDDGSRAVALLFNKSLSQTSDNEFLQRLLEEGYIEGIISLPAGVLPDTIASSYLVIFSKGNKSVKCLSIERDKNNYSKLDIEKIIDLYNNPTSEEVDHVDTFTLKALNSLVPSSIHQILKVGQKDKSNYLPLKSLCTDIFVGTQYTAKSFDITDKESEYQILTSSNIDENFGVDLSSLSYVNVDKSLYDKFIIHKGDVIVTSKSTKVKVAVIEEEPKKKVIVTGGMIIVRPDTDNLNPYYLKMYLDSPEGVEELSTTQNGSSIIHISFPLFQAIRIPDTPIEEQDKKALIYTDKLSSIKTHQKLIKELEEEMKYILLESLEE